MTEPSFEDEEHVLVHVGTVRPRARTVVHGVPPLAGEFFDGVERVFDVDESAPDASDELRRYYEELAQRIQDRREGEYGPDEYSDDRMFLYPGVRVAESAGHRRRRRRRTDRSAG